MNLKVLDMSKFTIQDIFINYGDEYIKNHKLSNEQWKVFNAIRNCGTKELGYHICTCEECGKEYFGFNSCRNRHCPMCQNYAREKWIQKEASYLLDTKYFHIITTVPYELNKIFLYNKKILYNILFKATSEAILELSEDPKWLGAKVGITSILHTWGQTMEFHPHIHSIVTGGGLKNNKWVSCDKDYLFKVQVLGSLFRGKFLYYLKHEFNNLALKEDINDIKSFNKFLEPLYNKTWITYIEPPKGKTENVITTQTEKALKDLTGEDVRNTIIAYEPIWAIGTGKVASANDANESIKKIRGKIKELYGEDVAEDVIILYGGSVKPENAKELFSMSDIDGALVGGASLKVDSFSKIVNFDK